METINEKFKNLKVSFEGGRKAYFYAHHAMIHMYSVKNHKWPLYVRVIGIHDNHLSNWYFIADDEVKYNEILQRVLKKSLIEEMEKYLTYKKNLVVKRLDFQIKDKKGLIELHKFYLREFENIMHTSGFLRNLDRGIILKIRNDFREFKNIDAVLRFCSQTDKRSFSLRERVATLDLASKIGDGKIDLNSNKFKIKIKEICNNFCWTSMGYFDEEPKTEYYYTQEVKRLLKRNPKKDLQEIIIQEKKEQKQKKGFLKNLTKKQKNIIFFANKTVFLKDYKKECLNVITYHAEKLFKALADLTGKNKSFIKDLTHEEIKKLVFEGRVNLNLVKTRNRSNVILAMPGKTKILIGKEADIFKKKLFKNQIKSIKKHKGRVASKGVAKGRAKTVISFSDFKKVKRGDILVVISTSPDYVDVIRKAAAIVAEEGGITSHVSIISREMKKPCIVGLPMATSIFKDGDMIEVDAVKGIVNILKRNK